MAKTISTLAYAITADTRSFVEGVAATKKEIKAAEGIMKAARSPAEEYADALRGIEELAKTLPPELFDAKKAVSALNKEFEDAKPKGFFAGMLPVIQPVDLALKGLSLGMEAWGKIGEVVTSKIEKSFNRIQDLGNTALSLGVSVEQFQVLEQAADQADVELETLKKGMFNLEKAVADAAGGNEKLDKVFKSLKLDAKELSTLNPAQQFRETAKALGEVSNASDRANKASDVFGSKLALELNRLVASGAEGFKVAEDRLREIGFVTDDDVSKIGALDGAWKNLNRQIDSVSNRLTADIAPALTDIVNEWDKAFSTARTDKIDGVAESVERLAEKLAILNQIALSQPAQSVAVTTAGSLARGAVSLALGPGAAGIFGAADVGLDAAAQARRRERANTENVPFELDPEHLSQFDSKMAKEAIANAEQKRANDFIRQITDADVKLRAEAEKELKAAHKLIEEAEKERSESFKRQIKDTDDKERKREEEAKRAVEAARTPMQAFREDLAKFKDMLDRGLITDAQFDAIGTKAIKDFDRPDKISESLRNPFAIRSGSQEAFAALVKGEKAVRPGEKQIVDELKNVVRTIKDQKPIEVEEVTL